MNHAGASGFNDRGQVAFLATFTDGSSGLFVSNLVAVPEPDTGLLCCLVVMAMGLCRRRQEARIDGLGARTWMFVPSEKHEPATHLVRRTLS